MTLSTQAREYMAKRDELDSKETLLIDRVFASLYDNCQELNLGYDGGDTGMELEASLIKFIIDSRN